jgi:hypothetical protein
MEKHLKAITTANSWEHTFKIQHAAKQGLQKLEKYSTVAKIHHSYILGTGVSRCALSSEVEMQITVLFVVLHPCLRSHWFAVTADSEDATAQEEAISTAEVVFKYLAETYLDMPASRAPTVAPKPSTKPVTKTPSFLASACSFQRPVTTSAVTISKRTPQEDLADELMRYLNFEAAPVERQEGEEVPSDEPSAHDVLLDPLLWWKVSTLVRGLGACILLMFLFRYMLPNFLPSLGWLGTIFPFLQQVSLSSESFQSPATFAAISAAH